MTKKSLTLFVLLAFLVSGHLSFAQDKKLHIGCGTTELMETLRETDPNVIPSMELLEEKITQYYLSNPAGSQQKSTPNAMLTIPVVVTIVHNGGPENISDVQVLSQINALNNYFNPYGLNFCLATQQGNTPFSGTTPGIFRVQNGSLMNHSMSSIAALMATSNLNPANYLRIWVVNDITSSSASGQVQGYGTFPASYANPNLDGIVMRYTAFGDQATCNCSVLNPLTNQGKVLVHEVGHYLALYHTFQNNCAGMNANDCASAGDKVCDTPPVQQPNTGCPSIAPNSCNETYGVDLPDDINNYMDYTNESCLNSFTDGQKSRMYATISQSRSLLVSASNLQFTGVNCASSVLPGFIADNYVPCVGTTVTFTANPLANATFEWDFGDGTSAIGQSVQHTYTSAFSPATVTLTATVGNQSGSTLKNIVVTACSPIQSTNAHWFFCDRNALDFTSGAPVFDNSALVNNTFNLTTSSTNPNGQTASESAAAQSDASGNLLFYTDGINVWNSLHQLINPSTPLGGHRSSNDGVLIVPDPGNSLEYYIFTNCDAGILARTGFTYSKITVAGGTPQLVAGQVNIPILAPAGLDVRLASSGAIIAGEGLTAIAKSDGYFIIAEAMNLARTGSYLLRFDLTSAGLQFGTQFSVYSWNFVQTDFNSDAFEIKAAPNGRHIAFKGTLTNPGKVIDFDPCTGSFSNLRNITGVNSQIIFAFSPNSKFLYAINYSSSGNSLYQIKVTEPLMPSVKVSQLFTNTAGMAQGPDNKIYLSAQGTYVLETIHAPDQECTPAIPNACLYTPTGPVVFNSPNIQSLYYTLPNTIVASSATVYSNEITYSQDFGDCFTFDFEANVCANNFSWNFGDPSSIANTSTLAAPSHTFSAPGIYTVTLVANGITITQTVEVAPAPQYTGPTTICPENGMTANYSFVVPSGYTCEWAVVNGTINGLTTQSNVDVTWTSLPGTLVLSMTNLANGCTTSTSITISESCETPCLEDASIVISSNPNCQFGFSVSTTTPLPNGYVSYQWNFGDGNSSALPQPVHTYANQGTYQVCVLVKIFNNKGAVICEKEICETLKVKCTPTVDCPCTVKPEFTYDFDFSECMFYFMGDPGVPECTKYVNYFWDFGDGTTSIGQFPNHIYSAAGVYLVTLHVVVTDENNKVICEEKVAQEVVSECKGFCECKIDPQIIMEVDPDGTTICDFRLTPYINPTCTNIISIQWIVNNVYYPPTQTIYLSANVNTNYEICLVVTGTDSDGKLCKEKVCTQFYTTDCYPIPSQISPELKGVTIGIEASKERSIQLYPNPTDDQLTIDFKDEIDENAHILIRSMKGDLLREIELSEGEQGALSIDVSSLPNGIYYVEVQGSSFVISERFVVVH